MRHGHSISVVIPALDEAAAIGSVLAGIPAWVDRVIVADNGSTDHTGTIAEQHGATTVRENRRGYGWACRAGIHACPEADILVFLDADGSEQPAAMQGLVDAICLDGAHLALGNRPGGNPAPGALTATQRWGNRLATTLIAWRWRFRYADLAPLRAIRRDALERLQLTEMTYGWTVEMQIRALQEKLKVVELPTPYQPRRGRSKVSGTWRGVIGAGIGILRVVAREAIRPRRR